MKGTCLAMEKGRNSEIDFHVQESHRATGLSVIDQVTKRKVLASRCSLTMADCGELEELLVSRISMRTLLSWI